MRGEQLPAPAIAAECSAQARPGFSTCAASEYLDSPAVLLRKAEVLATLLMRSQNCLAYTGAGISTGAGIEDYASKANNSVALSSCKGASTTAGRLGAPPTAAHSVLTELYKKGILKHWVQQNHDGLPQKAGYPQDQLNEVHGARCLWLAILLSLSTILPLTASAFLSRSLFAVLSLFFCSFSPSQLFSLSFFFRPFLSSSASHHLCVTVSFQSSSCSLSLPCDLFLRGAHSIQHWASDALHQVAGLTLQIQWSTSGRL